jgi:hypothetical protein
VEPAISVTIAVAVLLAFVLYSGLTLSTLGSPVARAGLGGHRRGSMGASLGNALVGAGLAGAGLPIGGPAGPAGQLVSTCTASRTVTGTAPAVRSTTDPAMPDQTPSVTMTAELPTTRRPSRPATRTRPTAGPVGDLVTDPVGEPPPLLWLRDQAGSKDLTQSGKNCESSEPD